MEFLHDAGRQRLPAHQKCDFVSRRRWRSSLSLPFPGRDFFVFLLQWHDDYAISLLYLCLYISCRDGGISLWNWHSICAQQVVCAVFADRQPVRRGRQDRLCSRPEGRADALQRCWSIWLCPAMIVNSYQDGVQRGDPAQPAGRVRAERAGHPASAPCITLVSDGPPARTAAPPSSGLPRVFSNAAYMGFPLISALFGAEGPALRQRLRHGVQYPALDHGLRHGQRQCQRQGHVARSLLRTPVFYAHGGRAWPSTLLQIPVPHPHRPAAWSCWAGMNTPLSMLITGILIAVRRPEAASCRDQHIWKLAGVRMLLIPAVCLAAFAAAGAAAIRA